MAAPSALPLAVLLLLQLVARSISASYSDHCPFSASADVAGETPYFSTFSGSFSGGDPIFSGDRLNSFRFFPRYVRPTLTTSLFHLAGTLALKSFPNPYPIINSSRGGRGNDRGLRYRVIPRMPRVMLHRAKATLELDGYWSGSAGEACLVGTGSGVDVKGNPLNFSAVVSIHYPKVANIGNSFISGSVKYLNYGASGNDGFDKISFLTYNEGDYEYTRLDEVVRGCRGGDGVEKESSLSILCSDFSALASSGFLVDNAQQDVLRQLGLSKQFVMVNRVQCDTDGKVRIFAAFSDQKRLRLNAFVVGNESFVGEGYWDPKQRRMCVAACRVVGLSNFNVSLVAEDCSFQMSFWFPSVWSIGSRSAAVGQLWKSGSDNLTVVSLHSVGRFREGLLDVSYNYTRVDEAKEHCLEGDMRKRKDRYPDGSFYRDFAFEFFANNSTGFASPVSIGDKVFDGQLFLVQDGNFSSARRNRDVLNVSYSIFFNTEVLSPTDYQQTKIAAEGIYSIQSGSLCLMGCREVSGTEDCKISIKVQFVALNPGSGDHLKGTISSLRDKSDPLFFDSLKIFSQTLYVEQEAQSRWRMDVESIMVIVSLTLSCVFISLQLFHVKKHPQALPYISITMLAVTSVGYLIPLVLNFEALFFTSHSKQSTPLWTGGWVEMNEVVVRIMALIAFLLQLRLLQVAWNGRSGAEDTSNLFSAERKVLFICLPLFVAGAVIVSVVHMSMHNSSQLGPPQLHKIPEIQFEMVIPNSHDQHSIWEDLVSYAGLVLDGFLLPQVIFNAFMDSKQNALSPFFYVGGSMIRAVPHIYDAFRAQEYLPRLTSSYIYANPRDDLYTLTWDIVVPLAVLLLVVLINLQQRFGGSFFICTKYRVGREYEMVSTVGS